MKYIMFYPECVIITAVVLYIKHLLYPYDFREKFPYDDPPPKFFGSFSLGELVQYIIQVLTLPIIGFAMIPLQFLGKVADVILIILLVMWWFIPTGLARKIDDWYRKASLYKSRGRFSIAVRYVLERAKGICEDRINSFHQMRRVH